MSNASETLRSKVYSTLGLTGGNEFLNLYNAIDVLSSTEVGYIDGVTAGTAAAGKALVLSATSTLNSIGTVAAGTITNLSSTAATITTLTTSSIVSGAGNGAIVGADVASVVETGDGVIHKTVLTLAASPTITFEVADDSGHGNVQLYDFPAGRILILGVTADLSVDVSTSANISDAGSGDFSLGTTGTADGTLDGTDVNLLPSTAMTDPFVTGVGAAVGALAASAQFDGTGTAKDLYLSMIFDAGDVTTGDGIATITGTVTITWINLGDY